MSYIDNFTNATNFTKELGLDCPEFQPFNESRRDEHLIKFFKESINYSNEFNFIGNCQIISKVVMDLIHRKTNINAYITIGNVIEKNKLWYDVDRSTFINIINGKSTETKNIGKLHTWITLDSTEIIDMTYFTISGTCSCLPLVGNPDQLSTKGLEHIPFVVGDDLFIKHMSLYDLFVRELTENIIL